MARIWSGGAKDPQPEPEKGSKTCPRCKGYGVITVKSAKTVEHGGFEDYDEPCGDCGGTGQVPT